MKTAENLRVRRMVLCALFAALTAVCRCSDNSHTHCLLLQIHSFSVFLLFLSIGYHSLYFSHADSIFPA